MPSQHSSETGPGERDAARRPQNANKHKPRPGGVANTTTWDLLEAGGKVDRDALLALYEQNQANGDDEAPVAITFTVSRHLDKRLDRYLVDRIPFLSRTSLQRLIKEASVTVNDRVPKPSTKLRQGDRIVAVLPPPPSSEIPAEEIPLHILFEDDDILVLNKQADIIVHPARGHQSGTIINGLAWHYKNRSSGSLSTVGEEFARPGVVHRLDRHTTGVMITAKTDTAHWRLGKQFERRTTDKRYLAVVHGRMEPVTDVIDLPLGKHHTIRDRYAVRWDETGKPSVTVYRVREVYDDFTLVEVELRTGRTHQIRVHLSHIGFPIVGDDYYGGKHLTVGDVTGPRGTPDRSPREPLITRQALHAAMLRFDHPISEERVTMQAPLHEDMRDLVTLLRQTQQVKSHHIAGTEINLDEMIPPAEDDPISAS